MKRNSSISKFTKSILFVLGLIILSFFFVSQANAANSTYTRGFFDNWTGPFDLCSDTSGCDPIAECWNSWAPGATDCGTACYGGNAWTKYSVSGCYQIALDKDGNETCQSTYEVSAQTCSSADKYNSSNPSVMNAGYCNCSPGGPYKTCCQGTTPVAANPVVQDPYLPPEAACPAGTSTLFCNFGGYPSCGQPTCDTLASTPPPGTPPPGSTPPPATPPPATPPPSSGCSGAPPGLVETGGGWGYTCTSSSCSGAGSPADACASEIYQCVGGVWQYQYPSCGVFGQGYPCTGCGGGLTPPPSTPPPTSPPSQHCYECKSDVCWGQCSQAFYIESWEDTDGGGSYGGGGACTNSMGGSCTPNYAPGSGTGAAGCWPKINADQAQQCQGDAQGGWIGCGTYWDMSGFDKDIGFCRLAKIQGKKIVGNDPNNTTGVSSETVTLTNPYGNTWGTDTNNSYLFYGVPPEVNKTYRAAVPPLAGYDISYSLCYNRVNCHIPGTPGYVAPDPGDRGLGNSVNIYSNKIGLNRGYVDLWWHYTPKPGTVQVEKVMMPGNQKNLEPASSQRVFYDTVSSTTNNPYSFTNIPPGSHTFSVSVPAGYDAGYTLCTGAPATWPACHSGAPTPGISVTFNVNSGSVTDLWWHYSKIISPWIQVTGDVHSNTGIKASGGP